MNYNIENKAILVTGANGQLGLSLVDNLVKQKAIVIATDIKSNNISRLIKKRNWSNQKILFFKCDLKEEKQVKSLFKSLKSKIVSLDALVCSPYEVNAVRKIFKKEIITPGVQIGKRNYDQKRSMEAKRVKSDWLVIGRAITRGNIKRNIQNLVKELR